MPATSDDLVTEVRRLCRLPTATDLSATDILAVADQVVTTRCADVLRNADSSFWTVTRSVTLVSGTATIRIPGRALGAGLERIALTDSAGNSLPITKVDEADAWRWSNGGRDPWWPGRFAFVLGEDDITLLPTPTSADSGLTLRVTYQRQPSKLVATTACAVFKTPQTPTATTIGVSGSPTPPTSLTGLTNFMDVIAGDGAHRLVAMDLRPTAYVGSPTFEFTLHATTPFPVSGYDDSALAAGRVDYVAVAGETPYPQVPFALWPLLVSATAEEVMRLLGDRAGAEAQAAVTSARDVTARSLTTPRSRTLSPIINRNSYLRRGRAWRG